MKYLKLFEINDDKPQIGDYILVKPGLWVNIIFYITKIEKSKKYKNVYTVKEYNNMNKEDLPNQKFHIGQKHQKN